MLLQIFFLKRDDQNWCKETSLLPLETSNDAVTHLLWKSPEFCLLFCQPVPVKMDKIHVVTKTDGYTSEMNRTGLMLQTRKIIGFRTSFCSVPFLI